jgi:hypothetical protein
MHMLVIVQFRGGGYEVAWRGGGRNEGDGLGVDDENGEKATKKIERRQVTGNRRIVNLDIEPATVARPVLDELASRTDRSHGNIPRGGLAPPALGLGNPLPPLHPL